MHNKTYLLFFSFSFLLFIYSDAQDSRFNAGFVAGLNFAALEGNGTTNYIGLNTGIIGTAKITRHSQLGMEILFSQNGEYILPKYYPALQYGQVWLNHVEVPVHIDWLIGVFQKDKFYDWNLNIGLAYTRLLSYNIETIDKVNVNDKIIYANKDAILLQAGTTYNFTKKMGINFKASLPIRIKGLSWTLAARLIYMIK
ncbi:MAG: hypothetical protein JNK69_13455 [Saprospiraceae bacterium]|nr:hypothetical protein [Candidatus Vicinibacter proximus]MBL7824409.1 hypothetical protein [Saprospiraceae bacterium]MCC6843673.1 hypothetical protein [Saprospiraceae bacterium]